MDHSHFILQQIEKASMQSQPRTAAAGLYRHLSKQPESEQFLCIQGSDLPPWAIGEEGLQISDILKRVVTAQEIRFITGFGDFGSA
jgi:hypothetical protein